MRHTARCVLIAFLASVLSFILIPIIYLLPLEIRTPGGVYLLFHSDALIWAWIFGGPFLLAGLITIVVLVGFVVFLVAKAYLP
jgi:hypothetical protein